jgi:hypothetical protein
MEIKPAAAEFAGTYEHLYRNSVFSGSRSLPTHYVVLAFRIRVKKDTEPRADSQHKRLAWFRPRDLLRSGAVHKNTKAYFRKRGMACRDPHPRSCAQLKRPHSGGTPANIPERSRAARLHG